MSSLSTPQKPAQARPAHRDGWPAAGAGGCGAVKHGDNANPIDGKQQFVAKCGSCHTLARANTKGIVGPNLDDAFRQSRRRRPRTHAIRGIVERSGARVPNPGGVMPKELASGAR